MIENIVRWFDADPKPSAAKLNVQLGCHLEEVSEFLQSLHGTDTRSHEALLDVHDAISALADALKSGICKVVVADRIGCLDAICDQIVTATGVGTYANLNVELGLSRVVASNDKFDRAASNLQNELDPKGRIICLRFAGVCMKPESCVTRNCVDCCAG
jgi:hypothetical protein